MTSLSAPLSFWVMIWRAACAAMRPKSFGVMAISSHCPNCASGSKAFASSSEISSAGMVTFSTIFFCVKTSISPVLGWISTLTFSPKPFTLLRAAARSESAIALITISRLIPFSRSRYSKIASKSLFIRSFLFYVFFRRLFLFLRLLPHDDVIAIELVFLNQILFDRKGDFLMFGIEFDHFSCDFIVFLDHIFHFGKWLIRKLRHVDERLDAIIELDKRAKGRCLRHCSVDD